MTVESENRARFRRYEDRRVALFLRIYEIFFEHSASASRDAMLLEAILHNFGADRGAFLTESGPEEGLLEFGTVIGDWPDGTDGKVLGGAGLAALLQIQADAPGAVTLARVKRPASFGREPWNMLWEKILGASALLSVIVPSQRVSEQFLWLVQSSYSREWSSRDRELAEEISFLLARARDKDTSRRG